MAFPVWMHIYIHNTYIYIYIIYVNICIYTYIYIHESLKEMTHFHGNLPEAIFKNSVSRIAPDDIVSDERVIRKHLNMAKFPRKGVKTVIAVIPTADFHNDNTNQYKPH